MNCDTAFDLMTDAHGSRSGALAQHFDSCPRCRRMQEALSPALDFLSAEGPYDSNVSQSPAFAGATASREPFVTTETVQLARQTADALAVRTEMPRARLARLTARSARYAAAFAAGLLFAVMLFNQHDRSTPPSGTSCTRREASTDDALRTPAQIQALVQSCAVCHQSVPAHNDDESMLLPNRVPRSWDWLLPILEEQRDSLARQASLETGQMIAGVSGPAWPNREQV
jgi:hypothetical protein